MLQNIGQIYTGLRDLLAGPMLTALVFLYHQLSVAGVTSWGLTIIVFTLLVKLIFAPLTMQQIRSSRALQALQPELQELKRLHGKDKEKLMQEQMRLYKENRVNPMAGCLPMLVQFPIWIGLYQALFLLAERPEFAGRFLWVPNLAQPEPFPYILAVLTGLSQFVVQRMMMTQNADPQQQAMNQAMQFMPIMYIFISFRMPAGLVLYWVASNLFSLVQQYFITGWGGLIPQSATVAAKRLTQRTETPSQSGSERRSGAVAAVMPPSSNGSAKRAGIKKRRK